MENLEFYNDLPFRSKKIYIRNKLVWQMVTDVIFQEFTKVETEQELKDFIEKYKEVLKNN